VQCSGLGCAHATLRARCTADVPYRSTQSGQHNLQEADLHLNGGPPCCTIAAACNQLNRVSRHDNAPLCLYEHMRACAPHEPRPKRVTNDLCDCGTHAAACHGGKLSWHCHNDEGTNSCHRQVHNVRLPGVRYVQVSSIKEDGLGRMACLCFGTGWLQCVAHKEPQRRASCVTLCKVECAWTVCCASSKAEPHGRRAGTPCTRPVACRHLHVHSVVNCLPML
jgi:hypothetical protein